ncbi:MAG: patatin-like phospholipase family protein [Solirubrobacterales bacterium]|nr:patatin-like phospholipase family protein [Solirubrobacterales bacterium]
MTIDIALLADSPVFAGLGPGDLEAIAQAADVRTFEPGEPLCEAGQPSDRCWLITGGLVDVLSGSGDREAWQVVARQRRGSTVGEVAVILDEPYSETVVASIPTSTLEIDAEGLAELARRAPRTVLNVLRALHGRLAHARARGLERQRGERVALVVGPSLRRVAGSVLAAARSVSPRPLTTLDRQFSFAGAVAAADDLALSHATVVLPVELDAATVATLMREADRVVALVGTLGEAEELSVLESRPGLAGEVEVILVGEAAARARTQWSPDAPLRVVRTCEMTRGMSLASAELAWVARHLTRTKLGLALGAGGAKGYAHVGVLQALEEAGYIIDCVAGSSIGAIVGAYLALGANAVRIEQVLRAMYDRATVAELFKTSLAGRSTGIELMTRLLRETTEEKTFADTVIPLTIMAVSLSGRAPAPLRAGPLWEALLAATALVGVFPPYERDDQRLVDGLALVPVPTEAVIEDGADVVVAVNLISANTSPRWPGGPPPDPPPERRRRGVLDDLLEVMDLSQLSESTRNAQLADVVITPRFGPGEWRDFHLADLFLDAGRAAAEEQLPALRSLALPASRETTPPDEGGGVDRADAVRI